jgi:hypothetical protein
MKRNRTMTEFIGSLAVVFFAVGTGNVMATGLVLAVFMIAMGGTILPMFTLAKMASGRDEIEDGMNDFIAQMFGGIVAYSILWWQTSATETLTWAAPAELGPYTAVASLFAGFLMMMVYDRRGGGWEVGVLAWMVGLAGATVTSADDFGGMIVSGQSAYTMPNMMSIFGGMIASGLGAYLAIRFGAQLLTEEE